jgi:hypothetical protein
LGIALGNLQPGERQFQGVARRGRPLQSPYLDIEVHDERLILALAQDLIQECIASAPLFFQHSGLAAAGVN